MEMRLCPNNHYYDHSISRECPICKAAASAPFGVQQHGSPMGVTMPVGLTQPAGNAGGYSPTVDNNRTQAVIKDKIGIDPVVGWLVCLEGKDKGRDYRIHSDNNYIGRAENMDIVILNDDTITRVNHAIISYDMREKIFYFAPGSGRGIVRVNGKAVLSAVELAATDQIDIGNTKLVFVPFCGEDFSWVD